MPSLKKLPDGQNIGNVDRSFPLYSLLPPEIRRRLKALKNIQQATKIIEGKFFHDVHKLECSYMDRISKLYKLRERIITGKFEPSDSDCEFDDGCESPDDEDPYLNEERNNMSRYLMMDEKARGIPGFWLTAFRNIDFIKSMITADDEPVLRYLTNVTVQLKQPLTFILCFKFSSNPYFRNKILTKTYEMEWKVDGCPWIFKGTRLAKVKGCAIEWYDGMDITKRDIVQMKGKKLVFSENKIINDKSFFNFFNPRDVPEDSDPNFHKVMPGIQIDFMKGVFIRETLVPHAVLYYTGEAFAYNKNMAQNINADITHWKKKEP